MSAKSKIVHEVQQVALVTAFFAIWLGLLMVLKVLILEEYQIHFGKISLVIVGALVLAKVVIILEHVPLGAWTERQPSVVDLILRTGLYAVGALFVMLLEKAFESRHEAGGFGAALWQVIAERDIPHVWANALAVTGALLTYNLLSTVRRHLGAEGWRGVLLSRPKRHRAE